MRACAKPTPGPQTYEEQNACIEELARLLEEFAASEVPEAAAAGALDGLHEGL
jgi:hypothetical protein